MAIPINYLEFENSFQWISWLEVNHATETKAWLIIYKKKFQEHGLALDEAVEAALCFGWIDGSLRKVDQKRFALRFSPRKSNSVWSIRNIQRVERLIAERKMTDAGMAKIEEAQENGQWQTAIRREQVEKIPKELEAALRAEEGALTAYQALTASRKKHYMYWLQSAKREDTKRKRIQRIIEEVLAEA